MSKLVKIIRASKYTAFFTTASLGMVSWLFGTEPTIMHNTSPYSIKPIPFQEYLKGSREINGESFFIDAFTTIAYPGHLLGVKIYNLGKEEYKPNSDKGNC